MSINAVIDASQSFHRQNRQSTASRVKPMPLPGFVYGQEPIWYTQGFACWFSSAKCLVNCWCFQPSSRSVLGLGLICVEPRELQAPGWSLACIVAIINNLPHLPHLPLFLSIPDRAWCKGGIGWQHQLFVHVCCCLLSEQSAIAVWWSGVSCSLKVLKALG